MEAEGTGHFVLEWIGVEVPNTNSPLVSGTSFGNSDFVGDLPKGVVRVAWLEVELTANVNPCDEEVRSERPNDFPHCEILAFGNGPTVRPRDPSEQCQARLRVEELKARIGAAGVKMSKNRGAGLIFALGQNQHIDSFAPGEGGDVLANLPSVDVPEQHSKHGYFATSTVRLSRMTVTLISPG